MLNLYSFEIIVLINKKHKIYNIKYNILHVKRKKMCCADVSKIQFLVNYTIKYE